MIKRLLDETNLTQLRSLVSPRFFDVLPTKLVWSEGRALVRNYRDAHGFAEAREGRREALKEADLAIDLDDAQTTGASSVEDPARYAERVVTLYFHQLFDHRPTILDLRARALHQEGGTLRWCPAPMWTRWSEDFRGAMQEVYLGFYRDQDDRFRAGLDALGLEGASELFARHFGENVEATRFEVPAFVETFHDIFTFCRDEGIELPGDFLAFGVYLATMYENLDRLNVAVNVRRCFEAVAA